MDTQISNLHRLKATEFYQGKPRKNLVGKRFGKLTVMAYYGSCKKKWTSYWSCQCDCGKIVLTNRDNLIGGGTTTCGCSIIAKNSFFWKGHGDIPGTYWRAILKGAQVRNLPVTITIEHIWSLFIKQKQRCALTNMPLIFGKRGTGTASLDRIDSSKGYIKGNVQWVHKEINMMKQELSDERFCFLCNLVAEHSKRITDSTLQPAIVTG